MQPILQTQGMAESIIIPLRGLKQGGHSFRFVIGKEFFQGFECSQIKDADCTVKVFVLRHQTLLSVNCEIGGYVITECDRCLEDLTLKVDVERSLTVGFGSVDLEGDNEAEDVIVIDPTEPEVCLDQFVYDYICLSLPLVKVHPEGQCNGEVLKYLSHRGSENAPKQQPVDSPFSKLKDILNNKNN